MESEGECGFVEWGFGSGRIVVGKGEKMWEGKWRTQRDR